jgi:hypothetical protein
MNDLPVTALLVIYALAVARVTGLIVSDSITEPMRDRVIGWLDERPATAGAFLAELIQCPWCAGMWVSMAAAPLVWFQGASPIMLVPALALAFSQLTGMLAGIGR